MGGAESTPVKKTDVKQWQSEYNLSQDKVNATFKAFKQQQDAQGLISRDKFINIMSKDGGNDPNFAGAIFDSFDRDRNGSIDIKEYMALMGVTFGGSIEKKLEASFNLFDENGDGQLDKTEIERMASFVFRSMVGNSKDPLTEKQQRTIERIVNEVFDKVDSDKSGTLDRNEFNAGFKDHPEICNFFKQF
eukprot:TRINITY_DN2953_c0_g2_i1.p1 TRINITY_DN2953_c0_g2~~TRINITY_DN2953_c0_g2_i1.p1  ORF type:complete len:190 (+),score=64.39 TRINITY_DN2953_c0_g2_i1:198-767(+)